jgi:hypothetical protein
MVNKKVLVMAVISLLATFTSCYFTVDDKHYIKDLNDNMIDLRAYHENLGDALKQNDMDIADWLATGMDSVLNLMGQTFKEHRRLKKPFSYYYENRLKPYMADLKMAVKKGDNSTAIKSYSALTRKCNSCHIDHDMDKEVFNWAQ